MGPFVTSDGVCPGLKRQETKQSASQQARPSDPDPSLFQTVLARDPGLWKAGSILPSWFPCVSLSGLKQPLRSTNKEEEEVKVPAAACAGLLKQRLLGQA